MILDEWQQQVLETKGNLVLRSGRQVGKSTIISIKAAKYALDNPDKLIMVISKTERQAGLLFAKILRSIFNIDKTKIKKGKDRPTLTKINLVNGSVIYCLPAGDTGYGIMGFTIDLLIADEAAFIPEEVWNSVVPALAITRGNIWLLSTPFVKEGFYYQCFDDPTFTSFHQSAEDCPRRDDVFLKHKKETLTKSKYAQMYLGEFIDESCQFFPTELIRKCMTLPQNSDTQNIAFPSAGGNFLGVDVARMGEDESVLFSVHRNQDVLTQIALEITEKTLLTETAARCKNADKRYIYRKIYIDATGVGAGVFDILLADDQTKRKVVAIENKSKSLDVEDPPQRKRILKEDLYNNLKKLMENNQIRLFNNPKIELSLKSIQFEYKDGILKIDGSYAHITEALVRAAWCMKDKGLNIYVSFN